VLSTPSTTGFQALIVPSSVAKMNRAASDLPFSVTMKSVLFGLMFPTTPVGVPRVPAGLLAEAGIVTNRGCWPPAPLYSVENPEPLSLSQNGLVGSAVRPQELIKCCGSVEGATLVVRSLC
jgi:hypothetical protein